MKKHPNKIHNEIDKLREFTDRLGMPIDKKILTLVAAMRIHGFFTTASCAGHLNRASPYVQFQSKSNLDFYAKSEVKRVLSLLESDPINRKYNAMYEKLCIEPIKKNTFEGFRLHKLLEEFYIHRVNNQDTRLCILTLGNGLGGFRVEPQGSIFIEIKNKEEKKLWLRSAQKEMNDFAEFLISKLQ